MKTTDVGQTEELRFNKNLDSSTTQNGETFFWAQMESVSSASSLTTAQEYKVILLDISERKLNEARIAQQDKAQERLMHDLKFQAAHDPLTGLVNRREFENRLNRLLLTMQATTHEVDHALFYIDLDQFKVVNDMCGHLAGDELLKQLTKSIAENVRQRDTFARMGGDEFAILTENCTLDQAYTLAESVRETVEYFKFYWGNQVFKLSASIGIVRITPSQTDLAELLKWADQACYMAKSNGRNRVYTYDNTDLENTQWVRDVSWISRIKKALLDDQFELYVQPIQRITGNSGLENHFEILLRMLCDQGKVILPGAFMGAAERFTLVPQLDTWVIKNLMSMLKRSKIFFDRAELININLSALSIGQSSFLKFVLKELKHPAIDASKICFELTETAAIKNVDQAAIFMKSVKALGCKFALDDFGIGLSSFAYLKTLPIDMVKIDGLFVRDVANDDVDYTTVHSINEIGHAMGIQTVAECVEDEATLNLMRKIGIDFVQGIYCGAPISLTQMILSRDPSWVA